MSVEKVISSQEDTMKLLASVLTFSMQYPRWVQEEAKKIVEKTMLPQIRSRMKDFNYSTKIINELKVNEIRISDSGLLEIDIENEFTVNTDSGTYDVAKGREEGTRRHFIKPVVAAVLSFIINNIRAFSKGHWVKGITKSNVITKTVEEFTPQVQELLNQATDKRLIERVR